MCGRNFLNVSPQSSSPWEAISLSPHHAAPFSSQTQRDRHINTPLHPIEHREGNPMKLEECSHQTELL